MLGVVRHVTPVLRRFGIRAAQDTLPVEAGQIEPARRRLEQWGLRLMEPGRHHDESPGKTLHLVGQQAVVAALAGKDQAGAAR